MKANELESNSIINNFHNEQLDFTLCQVTNQLHNADLITHVKKCLNSKEDVGPLKKHSLKKGISNKQNKESSETISSKNFNYLNLSRSLQEKCSFISKQKEEISVLKKLVSDIKDNKQRQISDKNRQFDLQANRLRQQEKEYIQNLREIQQLKSTLKEIIRKYELISIQKNNTSQRYNDLLKQNQQLTVVISNLKVQLELAINESKKINLQEENSQMIEQIRNLQLQKEAIENRCSNFQKKINEYILKYNQLQESSNQCQIKYYKLQKDCDNLRVDKDQIQQKFHNISKQLQAEREINQQEVGKLKAKFKKYQEKIQQQTNQNMSLKEAERRRYCENQELEQLSDGILKLKEENGKLRGEGKIETNKWEKYIKKLTKEFSQSKQQLQQQYLRQQNTYTALLETKQKQFQALRQKLGKYLQKQRELQQHITLCNNQLDQFKQKWKLLEQQTSKHRNIEEKCHQLIDQNQRITAYYSKLLSQKDQIIQKLTKNIQQFKDQSSHQLDSLDKEMKESQFFSQQNKILHSENRSLTEMLAKFQNGYEQSMKKKQQIKEANSIQNIKLSQQLIDSVERQSNLKHQIEGLYEQMQRLRDQEGKQKRYYQQKYQNQLQQYNSLSKYLSQVNLQNYNLLKNNTTSVLEIKNIKVELASTQANFNALQQQKFQETSNNKQVLQYKSKINQLCSQIQTLLLKLKQKENQIAKMNNEITDLHQLNHNLGMRCEQLIQDHNHLSGDSSLIESQLKHQINQHLKQIAKFKQSEEKYCKIIKEKDFVISKIKSQASVQIKQVHEMTVNLQRIQDKYRTLSDQYGIQSSQWQIQKQQFRKQWVQYHQFNQSEKKDVNNIRMSVSSYLDTSQVAVDILRQQNLELQRIFDCQIQRRNDIIRELIKQKKTLYQQLTDYRSNS